MGAALWLQLPWSIPFPMCSAPASRCCCPCPLLPAASHSRLPVLDHPGGRGKRCALGAADGQRGRSLGSWCETQTSKRKQGWSKRVLKLSKRAFLFPRVSHFAGFATPASQPHSDAFSCSKCSEFPNTNRKWSLFPEQKSHFHMCASVDCCRTSYTYEQLQVSETQPLIL